MKASDRLICIMKKKKEHVRITLFFLFFFFFFNFRNESIAWLVVLQELIESSLSFPSLFFSFQAFFFSHLIQTKSKSRTKK